jgi:hypothetical protein
MLAEDATARPEHLRGAQHQDRQCCDGHGGQAATMTDDSRNGEAERTEQYRNGIHPLEGCHVVNEMPPIGLHTVLLVLQFSCLVVHIFYWCRAISKARPSFPCSPSDDDDTRPLLLCFAQIHLSSSETRAEVICLSPKFLRQSLAQVPISAWNLADATTLTRRNANPNNRA